MKTVKTVKKMKQESKAKSNVTALAPVKAKPREIVRDSANAVTAALGAMARVLSSNITPRTNAMVMSTLRSWKKVMEDMEKVSKQRILELLKEEGEIATEKGTRRLEKDGWLFECRPYRSGTDPKKLEGLLRAKSLDPSAWMATKITYDVDESKLGILRHNKDLSDAELEACKFDETWTVLTPEQVPPSQVGEKES